MSYIETSTGLRFTCDTIDPNKIDACDIIGGLSRACRFSGQLPDDTYYSVAEHTVNVVNLLPKRIKPFGLLHDASEAYICDIARPWKAQLPDYRALEARLQTPIYEHFLGRVPNLRERIAVKRADDIALKAEARILIPSGGVDWECLQDVPDADVEIYCWEHATARRKLAEVWRRVLGGVE